MEYYAENLVKTNPIQQELLDITFFVNTVKMPITDSKQISNILFLKAHGK